MIDEVITSEQEEQAAEDQEILTEVALNEKFVHHPRFGTVRLTTPTLEIQRKIDAVTRKRRKFLKNAVDEVADEEDPTKITRIPAYRSRKQLEADYKEIGWWTEDEASLLKELSTRHLGLIANLELLGFESDDRIMERAMELRTNLVSHFEDDSNYSELSPVIMAVSTVSAVVDEDADKPLRNQAGNSDVDEWLDDLAGLRVLFQTYKDTVETFEELNEMQSEYSELFSDCWQDQLQYYIRLAQVFYCTSLEDGSPLWPNVAAIEKEEDINVVRWAFEELSVFWQGITEETRERMKKYGFMVGRSEEPESLEDSPETPQSRLDGESPKSVPTSSSELTDITEH